MPQTSLHSKFYYKVQITLLGVFCFFTLSIYAQQNQQLNREWGLSLDSQINKIADSSLVLSPVKPYIIPIQRSRKGETENIWKRKLLTENLVLINDSTDKFYLTIDPLFNFEAGKDLADSSFEVLFKNTRGILLRGAIGEKFYFESSFYENQAVYAQYIDNYIATTGTYSSGTAVVPGQGRAKQYRTNGYDFSMASGCVSYSPVKMLNLQVGHGKHFIGDGYRSLLLSDNAYNYPYARITSSYKNIQYTNLYTVFMNLTDGGVKTPANIERLFQKKVGNFQLLSFNFFKRLQLGLFQGMLWEPADTLNKQHLNFNTFNPLIGVNSAVYGLRSGNNIIVGSTFKFKITNAISLYGQLVVDDVKCRADVNAVHNKTGYQIGAKFFNAFTIKNLHLQAEYNSVRPYTYSSEKFNYSYTHFNQALAHPVGANFKELVGFINYTFRNFFVQYKINYMVKGVDSAGFKSGYNVFDTDNNFSPVQNLKSVNTTQGLKTNITYHDFQVGYLVNPVTNFNIMLGVTNRLQQTDLKTEHTQVIYFAIRTSLANFYYDF